MGITLLTVWANVSNLTLRFLADFVSKYLSQQQWKCPLPKGKPNDMYFYSFGSSRAFIEIKYNLHALPSIYYLYLYKIIARKTVMYIQMQRFHIASNFYTCPNCMHPLMPRINFAFLVGMIGQLYVYRLGTSHNNPNYTYIS